jgi:glycosyltransferase involved in cell wall biosynthesis
VVPWWTSFWTPHLLYLVSALHSRLDTEICFVCHNVSEHEAHPLSRFCSRLVLSRADRVVVHSEQEADRARALLPARAQIITAFHPVYDHLQARMPPRAEARHALHLDGPVLLFFGFVRPYKGLDVLLSALPSVLQQHKTALLVVGEFWRGRQRYVRRIRELGLDQDVVLVDRYVPDEEVGSYFAAADLVVLPYLSGTGSGVCQLAFGMRRPVVATRMGSMPDVVRDGLNGRLVEPGDPAALAEAISSSLYPETLARLTRGAEATAREYSWQALAAMVTGEMAGR